MLFFREKVRVNGREKVKKNGKMAKRRKSAEARRYINGLTEGSDMKR
jgi:hypothetical protein